MTYSFTSADLIVGVHPITNGRNPLGRLALAWAKLGPIARVNSLELWQRQDGTRFLRWPHSARTSSIVAPSPELHEAVLNLICADYDRQAAANSKEGGGGRA